MVRHSIAVRQAEPTTVVRDAKSAFRARRKLSHFSAARNGRKVRNVSEFRRFAVCRGVFCGRCVRHHRVRRSARRRLPQTSLGDIISDVLVAQGIEGPLDRCGRK